jgi:hypothetical protein
VFSTGLRARRRPVGLIALRNCWLMQMGRGGLYSRVAKLLRRSGLNARDTVQDELWR